MYAYGDGMRRWFYLLGNMLVYKGAVHCIEEIDSTMHPTSQTQFCRRLAEFAGRFKNQIFLTSHNIEFADAFLKALFDEGGTYVDSQSDPVRAYTVHLDQGRAEVWPLRGRKHSKSAGNSHWNYADEARNCLRGQDRRHPSRLFPYQGLRLVLLEAQLPSTALRQAERILNWYAHPEKTGSDSPYGEQAA